MNRPSIIYLGADHAGFALKENVRHHLKSRGFEVEDLGAHALIPNDDYPIYAARVAGVVRENPRTLGLLFCGSAEGVCIAANKFDGIRAGIGYSIKAAVSLREDDFGNILCVPGRIDVADDPLAIVDAFLAASPKTDARFARRDAQVAHLEDLE